MNKFIDIAANLTDRMYEGLYNASKKHDSDLKSVLQRAWNIGVQKIIITGGDLDGSRKALEIANTDDKLYSTVGCHPTECLKFEKDTTPREYLSSLEKLLVEGKQMKKVVAVGECGLDYDRLHFCPKDIQKKYFQLQLDLNKSIKLPLFLHCRNSSDDFKNILSNYRDGLRGVVHTFDGTIDDLKTYLDMGLYIGINGCSLKTAENLEVVKQIPSDRLLLETDCPYCEVRPTHAAYDRIKTRFEAVKKEKWSETKMVKGRNEPCNIVQILEIVASLRNENETKLADQVFTNTQNLFFN